MMQSPQEEGFWLSPQQERIWNAGGNTVGFLRLDGAPDPGGVRRAVSDLVRLHEPLRTVYRRMPGMRLPFQVVLEASDPFWDDASGDAIDAVIARELGRIFNLERGPVVHVTSVSGGLVLTVPAVTADVPSFRIIEKQLQALLDGSQPDPAEIRYAQFAQWQRDLIAEEDSEEGKNYWKSQGSPPALTLPGERTVSGEYRGAVLRFELPDAPVPVLLGAWQTLIGRVTGQAEFAMDVFFPQRDYDELRDFVGLIGKQLPVMARFEPGCRFRAIAEQAAKSLETATKWADVFPGSESPASVSFDAADLEPHDAIAGGGKLRLSVRRGGALIQYDAAVLDRETVARWAAYFDRLLKGALADQEAEAGSLPLIGDDELDRMKRWNDTAAEYPADRCFHDLFEKQVEHTPGSPAVRCGEEELSYRELNSRANRLAHHLRSLGIGAGAHVGLALSPGVNTVAALLGILKSGAAFVPLNPGNPKDLLSRQLHGTAALVTERGLAGEHQGLTILVNDQDWGNQPDHNPEPSAGPDDLMYVIYTSGSTGIPKGVGVRHRNLVNYAWHIRQTLPGEHMRFGTVTTFSADLGNTCIYPALISGGCLHVIPPDVASDAGRFAAYQKLHPLDVLKIVPSHLSALLETSQGSGILPRRHLITGGEKLTRALVDRIRALGAPCEIWNHYGPTETTVGSLMLRLSSYAGAEIPIGKPIANTQIYLLNERKQPVPVGTPGELYIGGAGVAACYLGQPELTAERFQDGKYRTGDLARFLPDGNVEFLGRADDQVKIRGFRIEPGEIEAGLTRHSSVKQAVVVALDDGRGGRELAAYVVGRGGPVNSARLREYLKTQIPEYMVPRDIVPLARIPLTPNGKIDKKALPSPEQARASEREYAVPANEDEEAVARVWAATMRRERVGVEEDFFELGGHSLLATQIASRLREHFHKQVPVRAIFEYPTIRLLAAELASRLPDEVDDFDLVPIGRGISNSVLKK